MFKVTTLLTDEKIAGLLCSGMDTGGINYWAEVQSKRKPRGKMTVGEDWQRYPLYSYPVTPTGSVTIKDIETGKEYVLNRKSIQRGLTVMQEKYPRHFGNFLNEDDDAETGDVFIQCCLLGDVLYG